MNFLAFDTSTEALHLGVRHGDHALTQVHPGGAHASAHLIPKALRLLAEAGLALRDLDAIVVGQGPGSFTGLRTACAVAQGLAYGADLPVLPIGTLLAVAEEAREGQAALNVLSVLDARMGQCYVAAWSHEAGAWHNVSPPALLHPHEVALPPGWHSSIVPVCLAGTGWEGLLPQLQPPPLAAFSARHAAPTAQALMRLAPQALRAGLAVPAEHAMPLYVRDKVAQTTAEREARLAP
jgi:tRNA threonylcarbamoyladenosine biosynthesis protein TsaB